ncbi:hypothetical protein TL16_g02441 [Triparma laevis f. inornata]|uniref:peptidylprolyl isomerase n=1 Tax=Triparma laevis f. inornata TaxID=1714386 RepID=A0A9W7DVB4_9STRA|nr:hypothetical protein TL16_g02441 [Triparma laevis f. inornata]
MGLKKWSSSRSNWLAYRKNSEKNDLPKPTGIKIDTRRKEIEWKVEKVKEKVTFKGLKKEVTIAPPKTKASSAYPPMSKAVPKNPFSVAPSAAVKPSGGFSFSAATTPAPAPAPAPAKASSAYPPMSKAAPKNPFSAQPKAAKPSSGFSFGSAPTPVSSSGFSFGGSKNPPAPKPASNDSDEIDWKEKITTFYTLHNPSKLSTLPSLLEKYKGKEATLYTSLQRKYAPKESINLYKRTTTDPIVVMKINNKPLKILLYQSTLPLHVENFLSLLPKYINCKFHRVIQGFMAQTGDFTKGDGTGGQSKWGKSFEVSRSEELSDKMGKRQLRS